MPHFASQQFTEMAASRGRLPIVLDGADVNDLANSTVIIAATTFLTTTNATEANGAVYRVDAFVRVNTVDGGTTPTAELNILFTEGASVRTKVLPMITEAGAIDATMALDALSTFECSAIIKADQNTAIQYRVDEGGTPSNDGDFDVVIRLTRLS